MEKMIYLDYAATTPMSEGALQAYRKVAKRYYGNPSSIHDPGSTAARVVEKAREALAGMLGVPDRARGVFFTGSGSEANELALRSLLKGTPDRRHVVASPIEHSCVRNTLRLLEEEGCAVDYLPVDRRGYVDPEDLRGMLQPETGLVTVHHAHPELGVVQPLEELGEAAREAGVPLHSDAVQSFGKIPVEAARMGLSAVSVSAHKLYGPKGLGAVWMDPSVNWKGVMPGATQQNGFRQGTLDAPAVAAFLAALREAEEERDERDRRLRALHERMLKGLRALPFEVSLEGEPEEGLPGLVGLRVPGMEGQYLMLECNRKGVAISTGSACTVGTGKPPHTMTRLGYEAQEAREFIRLSFGKETGEGQLDRALEVLAGVVRAHYEMTGA
ncbi:MAG: IscS subfamily cysteine desulfurase [Balneolaceae bacterium]|nr:IscS subfamily cysteine desulfurase [Balneolaceae bacterium]